MPVIFMGGGVAGATRPVTVTGSLVVTLAGALTSLNGDAAEKIQTAIEAAEARQN